MNAETETAIQNLSKAFADAPELISIMKRSASSLVNIETSSAGHEAIGRADGPRSYPLRCHRDKPQPEAVLTKEWRSTSPRNLPERPALATEELLTPAAPPAQLQQTTAERGAELQCGAATHATSVQAPLALPHYRLPSSTH